MIPVVLLTLAPCFAGQEPTDAPEPQDARAELVVEMQEVSVFDVDDEADFLSGSWMQCGHEPAEDVRYPELCSSKPLYSMCVFSGAPEGDNKSFLLVVDESGGTGKGYDRLYLDLDRDGDLTDDEPLARLKDPPPAMVKSWDFIKEQACFEVVEIPCDFGAAGIRPVELMPALMIQEWEEEVTPLMTFIGTRAWNGELDLDGRRYIFYLGHDRSPVRSFDEPSTALVVIRTGVRRARSSSRARWWGGDRLSAMHRLGDTLYTFAASSTGDRLMVRPYAGECGELAIGAGDRDLEPMSAEGSLRSRESAVGIGPPTKNDWTSPVERCSIPVGDYCPAYLTVRYGDLSIELSNNYHTDGMQRRRGETVYGIEIREDRPFVLDFSTEPEVMFASPAKDFRLKPGDTLEVAAVLVDPKLDVMIRGLDDVSRQVEETVETDGGQTHTFRRNLSLDPEVLILRKGGEKVVEGTMPFG